jgi:hypothetical protein
VIARLITPSYRIRTSQHANTLRLQRARMGVRIRRDSITPAYRDDIDHRNAGGPRTYAISGEVFAIS